MTEPTDKELEALNAANLLVVEGAPAPVEPYGYVYTVCETFAVGDERKRSREIFTRSKPPCDHTTLYTANQVSVLGEVAEHYRNAITSACEGWTMPDGLRKHLETALWSPPALSVKRPAICDEHYLGNSWSDVINAVEAAHGIKGDQHGADA